MLRDVVTRVVARLSSREVVTFLGVGGAGYVVDVLVFNALRSLSPFSVLDPSVARSVAVAFAMCVTYAGNRFLTWRDIPQGDQRREVTLFVIFNVIGFSFSIGTLWISHDLMGLTSRFADNISSNVIGMALGTLFRFWSYRRFVFTEHAEPSRMTGPFAGLDDEIEAPTF
ncbi:MAG: GtrA family protein [Marmoricola sp.]|nr:GtrA family protein [Marmoricola sp.]